MNVVPPPLFHAALYQNILGRITTPVAVFGRRTAGWTSTGVYGDVSSYLDGTQAQNSAVVLGTTYYVRSSTAEDGPGGPGALSVRIVYLDSTLAAAVATVTLNGTTGVSLGNGIAYIQWMEVASGAAASGSITIASVAGAPTVAETVERIPPAETRSYSGRYKVPAGQEGYLLGWTAGAVAATMDMAARATLFSNDNTVSPVFHPVDAAYVAVSGQQVRELPYLRLPELTEIKISAMPGGVGAGNRADAILRLLLLTVG